MGQWGIKSYEVDEAAEALDAGFERAFPARYEELMDDRSPLTYEQVQERLAGPESLAAAVEVLRERYGDDLAAWEGVARLALAGVVVRHAELGVPIPDPWRLPAIDGLEREDLDWDEATSRRLRRQQEIERLRKAAPTPIAPGDAPA